MIKNRPPEYGKLRLPTLMDKAFRNKPVLTERELASKLSHRPESKTKRDTRLIIKNAIDLKIIEAKGPFGGRKLKKASWV